MRGNFWARTSLNVSVTYPLVWRGISPVTIFLALHSALMFACRYIPRTSVLIHIHVHVYINNSRHLARKKYLSADIICSEKRTVFRERSSRKTVSYEEQIMSKDKYPSIFSPQMGTIVFIILQIVLATRAISKLGNIPQF